MAISHHTKDKGDLGVLKVMADLASQGFLVLTPHTEHRCFDVVAYRDKFLRIQVKHCKITDGRLKVKLTAIEEVDVVAIYCPETDECYYVTDFTPTITLRVEATRNNQRCGVNFAADHQALVA